MNTILPPVAIVAWLSGLMTAEAPPGRYLAADSPKKAEVVASETKRYEAFAADVARVVYDPEESPLFDGEKGRAKTAMLLMAIAYHESGFRRDVDLGLGTRSRGDNGRSCTAFQFNIGSGKTLDGYTCKQMYADRELAVRAALHLLHTAKAQCGGKAGEWLSGYTAGHCIKSEPSARRRVGTANQWAGKYLAPMTDADAMQVVDKERREVASE